MAFGRFRDLLGSGGFQSFLWTQLLGAFNDNVYKIVVSLLAASLAAGSGSSALALAGAVFIVPFILFSGYAGHLADVYNKRSVLIATKSFEVVAMGLALRPRLLILDEPTQGLSDQEIEGFVELVRDIARTATVLIIEHNMDVVMQLAKRITVFEAGRILAEGSPDEIRADAAVQRAYLGTPRHG